MQKQTPGAGLLRPLSSTRSSRRAWRQRPSMRNLGKPMGHFCKGILHVKLVKLVNLPFSSVKGWVYVAVWVDGSLSSFVVHPTASQCHHYERCTDVCTPAEPHPEPLKRLLIEPQRPKQSKKHGALPSVKVRNYPQNLSQNNWRTLKVAPFMRFPLLSITYHHYHLIQSMSISQYGLHLYQAHRCQTKLCQTGFCFTRFLSSTSSLSCSMLCKPCNVCNGGSPLGNHLSVDEGKKKSAS